MTVHFEVYGVGPKDKAICQDGHDGISGLCGKKGWPSNVDRSKPAGNAKLEPQAVTL